MNNTTVSAALKNSKIGWKYRPIPKKELVTGKEYKGVSRNVSKAIWDGEKFVFGRRKPGGKYAKQIDHFEDDQECGYDVFVPIEEL